MSTTEIKSKPWVYRLYETENGYIIGVVFSNSYVDFSRHFRFESTDISDPILSEFCEKVVNDYESYKHLEVETPEL